VTTGRVIRRLQGHTQRINAVSLNDASTLLFTGSYDKSVHIWDLKSNMREPIQTLTDFRDSVTAINISRYEIYTSSVDGAVRIYDMRRAQLHVDELQSGPITHISLSNDQKTTLATPLGGSIQLIENKSGRVLQRYSG
jgi:mitogen-activated protein kinase organizer 1